MKRHVCVCVLVFVYDLYHCSLLVGTLSSSVGSSWVSSPPSHSPSLLSHKMISPHALFILFGTSFSLISLSLAQYDLVKSVHIDFIEYYNEILVFRESIIEHIIEQTIILNV